MAKPIMKRSMNSPRIHTSRVVGLSSGAFVSMGASIVVAGVDATTCGPGTRSCSAELLWRRQLGSSAPCGFLAALPTSRSSIAGVALQRTCPVRVRAPRLTPLAALEQGAFCNAAFASKLASSCHQSHATLYANQLVAVLLCELSRPHHGFGCDVAASMGFQRAISERTKRSNVAGVRSPLAGTEPPS